MADNHYNPHNRVHIPDRSFALWKSHMHASHALHIMIQRIAAFLRNFCNPARHPVRQKMSGCAAPQTPSTAHSRHPASNVMTIWYQFNKQPPDSTYKPLHRYALPHPAEDSHIHESPSSYRSLLQTLLSRSHHAFPETH